MGTLYNEAIFFGSVRHTLLTIISSLTIIVKIVFRDAFKFSHYQFPRCWHYIARASLIVETVLISFKLVCGVVGWESPIK